MAEEKTLDLKPEEKETSAGIGQPEEETSTEDIAEEINKILGEEEEEPEASQPLEVGDEEVVLSRAEWEKILRDKENYKKGLLSLKAKLKASKKQSPEAPKGEFLTREEFQKTIEKQAIAKACENPDIEANWDEIVKYYSPRRGKDSPEAILADIEDAYYLFRKYNPEKEKGEKPETKLSVETSKPKGESRPKKEEKRGGILPKPTPITEWYKGEE